jgi:hypothetical protein
MLEAYQTRHFYQNFDAPQGVVEGVVQERPPSVSKKPDQYRTKCLCRAFL